jgi:hypothetical protein
MLGPTVRVSSLIMRQPEEVRHRIPAAFDRLADGYRVDGPFGNNGELGMVRQPKTWIAS